MLTGYYSSQSALTAFQTSIDNTSNNLANMNTTAFKRNVVGYQDTGYNGPVMNQIGTGVKVGSISPTGFTQGTLLPTGNDTDIAIIGTGLLPVQMPDGTTRYTRDGSLHRDDTGRLVTSAGNTTIPPITFPSDTTKIMIGVDGTVTVLTGSSPTVPKTLGQLQLVSFVNQEGLQLETGNLYSETLASGPPTTGTPSLNGLGNLQQGSLEQSNVNMTSELTTLVATQQAYTANSKALATMTQMVSQSMELFR